MGETQQNYYEFLPNTLFQALPKASFNFSLFEVISLAIACRLGFQPNKCIIVGVETPTYFLNGVDGGTLPERWRAYETRAILRRYADLSAEPMNFSQHEKFMF